MGWFWKFRQKFFLQIFSILTIQLALIPQILIRILDNSPGDLFINFVPHRPDHSIFMTLKICFCTKREELLKGTQNSWKPINSSKIVEDRKSAKST